MEPCNEAFVDTTQSEQFSGSFLKHLITKSYVCFNIEINYIIVQSEADSLLICQINRMFCTLQNPSCWHPSFCQLHRLSLESS